MQQTQPQQDKVNDALQLFTQLSAGRGVFENHWQQIADLALVAYSNTFRPFSANTPGAQKTELQYDSTAAVALGRSAAVVDSLLTPYGKMWHGLKPSNPLLQKDYTVRVYFEEVTRLLFQYRYSSKANFASNNFENMQNLMGFGTGCMFTDALKAPGGGLRYRSIHLGEIYFRENHQGLIDTALRYYPMKARQAIQKWGKEKLPPQIVAAAEKGSNQDFYFIHLVQPNGERDEKRLDYRGMAYSSSHISVTNKLYLGEGGYRSFPYSISRYKTAPGEIYGRSPAMDVLPAMKTLNIEKLTMLKQGQRISDPVLLMHDDGIANAFDATPGSFNAGGVSAEGRPLVHVLPTGNLAVNKEMMDDERKVIQDSLLVTLFQVLMENPQMTATEVLERVREKGMLLAPTVGRQESEYVGPMVERDIEVLALQGLLPPMPPILIEAKGEYEVVYDSPMSRAMRAEEAAAALRSVSQAVEFSAASQNPEPLDHFKWDVIIPEVSDISGMPVSWRNTPEEIQLIRQNRAQQQQQQMMIQAAPAIAGAAKAIQPGG